MRGLTQFLLVGCIAACGPGDRDNTGLPDATGQDSADAPPATERSRVFAHNRNTLYQIDTATLAALPIGPMTGLVDPDGNGVPESLTDLAIDKTDRMFGVSLQNLYSINATTGAVLFLGALAPFDGFSSLSFVPDPNDSAAPDILVSANFDGTVYKLTETGSAMVIGSYGMHQGEVVGSSGDLIGVRGLGIYATVQVGTDTMDYLATVDPATWKATPLPNSTGYEKIFGLGFWEGKIYGFADTGTDTGTIIEINPTTGSASVVLTG
ncbi:MAG: hypothetical protein H0T79_10970, partial [Deltaproteobacteria bacterium]|nr:hypothetical protein [Deltaproteobacteria bacterium]